MFYIIVISIIALAALVTFMIAAWKNSIVLAYVLVITLPNIYYIIDMFYFTEGINSLAGLGTVLITILAFMGALVGHFIWAITGFKMGERTLDTEDLE